ncbi:MAG: hypothetical protein KJ607_06405, partial [Bacteroidetes bacterium]|nr:hypothetical protein [Bacteroidota bacterium]
MFILLLPAFIIRAQDTLNEYPYRATINAAYIKSCWYDTRDIAVSPLTWNRGEWIAAGSVFAATALLVTQDDGIQKFAQLNRNET